MVRKLARKNAPVRNNAQLKEQAAHALLTANFNFLCRNGLSRQFIYDFVSNFVSSKSQKNQLPMYQDLVKVYDDMGVIMATWFSDPNFLDSAGRPLPLSIDHADKSLAGLIRASGATVELLRAFEFMKSSPSVKITKDGCCHALRRVFVMPELEVPWAAFVVERYLDTVLKNVSSRTRKTRLLLERSCYVSAVDLTKAAPLLRDIENRATAFMDSIDGDIEEKRLRRLKSKGAGELGVLVFAWTRPDRRKKKKTNNALGKH